MYIDLYERLTECCHCSDSLRTLSLQELSNTVICTQEHCVRDYYRLVLKHRSIDVLEAILNCKQCDHLQRLVSLVTLQCLPALYLHFQLESFVHLEANGPTCCSWEHLHKDIRLARASLVVVFCSSRRSFLEIFFLNYL